MTGDEQFVELVAVIPRLGSMWAGHLANYLNHSRVRRITARSSGQREGRNAAEERTHERVEQIKTEQLRAAVAVRAHARKRLAAEVVAMCLN
jgi:hypothetical protein